MNVFPSTVAAAATPVLTHPTATAPMMIMMPQMVAPTPVMAPAPVPAQQPMMVDASAFLQFVQAQQQQKAPEQPGLPLPATPLVDNAAVQETVKNAVSEAPKAEEVAPKSEEPAAPLMPWEEGFSGEFPEATLPSNAERKAAILERKLARAEAKTASPAKKPVGRPAAVAVKKVSTTSHPTSFSNVSRVHLNGRTVVFAGEFKNVSTLAAQTLARKAGATPVGMMNLKSANFLVAGRGSKEAQAQAAKHGVRLIQFETFMRSCKK